MPLPEAKNDSSMRSSLGLLPRVPMMDPPGSPVGQLSGQLCEDIILWFWRLTANGTEQLSDFDKESSAKACWRTLNIILCGTGGVLCVLKSDSRSCRANLRSTMVVDVAAARASLSVLLEKHDLLSILERVMVQDLGSRGFSFSDVNLGH